MSPLKNKRLRQALLNYIISLLDKPGLLKTLKNEQLITRRAISTGICSCFSILIILMGHPAFRHFSTDITSSLVNTSNFFQELNSASSNQNLELAWSCWSLFQQLSWQKWKGALPFTSLTVYSIIPNTVSIPANVSKYKWSDYLCK